MGRGDREAGEKKESRLRALALLFLAAPELSLLGVLAPAAAGI